MGAVAAFSPGRLVMRKEVAELRLESPPESVWGLLTNPAHVLKLVPPELRPRCAPAWPASLGVGVVLEFNLRVLGLPVLWVMEITRFESPELMVSVQRSGPYRYWEHEQRLYPHVYGTIVEDRVSYEPMLGLIGRAASRTLLRPKVGRWLSYRHTQLLHWFDHGRWLECPEEGEVPAHG